MSSYEQCKLKGLNVESKVTYREASEPQNHPPPPAYGQPPPPGGYAQHPGYGQPPPPGYGYGPPPPQQQQQQQQTTVVVAGQPQTTVIHHKERFADKTCLNIILVLIFWPWIFVWIALCIFEK